MGRFIDLTGQKFNRLIVKSYVKKSKHGQSIWLCECECGNTKEILSGDLKQGHTRSCGCLFKDTIKSIFTTHNQSKSVEYNTWILMKRRCFNPKDPRFHRYGGRGIKVCKRWQKFENFLEDMGKRPEGMSLDRIDNNGNYEPENCKWSNPREQGNNRRNNLFITAFGETKTLSQWARDKRCGLRIMTLQKRLSLGWEPELAITTNLRHKL